MVQVLAIQRLKQTATTKRLPFGAYFSKTAPEVAFEDEDNGSEPVAILTPYDVHSQARSYKWYAEMPKKLASCDSLDKMMAILPAIFSKVGGPKYMAKQSDGQVSFLFQCRSGFLVIGINND